MQRNTIISIVGNQKNIHEEVLGVKLRVKEVVKLVRITQLVKQKMFLYKLSIAKGLRNTYNPNMWKYLPKNAGCKKCCHNMNILTLEQCVAMYIYVCNDFKFKRFINFSFDSW